MSRGSVFIVLLLAMVVTSCTAGDIDFALGEFGNSDLSASEDPAVRAAGDSFEAVGATARANELVDTAFESSLTYAERMDAFEEAQDLRPTDPRYDFDEYVFVFHRVVEPGAEDGRRVDRLNNAMVRAMGKLKLAHLGSSDEELRRRFVEGYLDASLRYMTDHETVGPYWMEVGDFYCQIGRAHV